MTVPPAPRAALPLCLLVAIAGCAAPSGSSPRATAPVPPAYLSSARTAYVAPELRPIDAKTWFDQTQKVFAALDRNKDKRIDVAELRAGFDALDIDKDGYLAGGEALSLVEAADRDGDGRLSRQELSQLPALTLEIDLDKNGSISAFELNLARTDEFGRADLNGDRRLDVQEQRVAERFSYFRF